MKKKLEEILNDLAYGQEFPDSDGNPMQRQVSVEEATTAILEFFKSVIPMPMVNDDGTPRAVDEVVKVWNECRAEILKAIEVE